MNHGVKCVGEKQCVHAGACMGFIRRGVKTVCHSDAQVNKK